MIEERQTNYRWCSGDVPGELRGSCKKQVKAGQRDKHERKRGERESSAGSDIEIRGGGAVSKNIFSALWALVWSTNKGATRPLPPGSSTGSSTVESLSSSPWSNLFISFSLLPPSTSILPSCNSLKPSFAVKSEKKLNFVIDRAGNIGNWSLEFSLISVLLGLLNSFKNCRKHFYYISPLCISHTLTVLSQSAYIFAACHYNLVLPRGVDV